MPHLPGARVLVVEARFYAEINDLLLAGARAALEAAGAEVDAPRGPRVRSRSRRRSRWRRPAARFDAFVALGCVIRGETTHYELVAGESCRGLMELGIRERARDRQRHPHGRERGAGTGARRSRAGRTRAAARPWPRCRCSLWRRRLAGPRMSRLKGRPILNKRRAARFAAVQALYQIELLGERPEAVCREFGEHRLGQLFEPFETDQPSPEVDREWFEIVVKGAWAAHDRLDPEIELLPRRGLDAGPLRLSSCAPACAPAPSSSPSAPTCRSRS